MVDLQELYVLHVKRQLVEQMLRMAAIENQRSDVSITGSQKSKEILLIPNRPANVDLFQVRKAAPEIDGQLRKGALNFGIIQLLVEWQ